MKDHLQLYIDGQWVDPAQSRTLEVINPSTEEAIARISMGSAADVDKAVAAARRAFETFSQTTREERLALLGKVLEVYQKRYGDIVVAVSQEMGAPLWLSKAAQAAMGVAHLAATIEVLKNFPFKHVQGTTAVVHEPVGVVGMITPWNWPINQIMCKVAPALAAGCTMVLKPSEVAPLNAMLVAEVLHEAGVPPGVFNLVNGDGPGVGEASAEALWMLAPVFILLLLAAVLGPAALGGWVFSTSALAPKFERLDPVRGLQRMFSVRSLVELLKAIAKVLLVGAITVLLLWTLRGELAAMEMQPLEPAIHHAVTMLGWSGLALSASTLLIAALDVPFQLFDHAQKLRMTMQQVRDELKESEGRPEVKSRIRQLQRQFARSRMMAAVPKADVVITNPTHYAVALRYDAGRAAAPMLLAKGSDLVALKIREIAEAHGVPVVSSPRLARAIWFTTEIEAEIPAGLYLAVAQVLAYVFHLRNYRRGRGSAPVLPDELPIPEGMDIPGGAARAG